MVDRSIAVRLSLQDNYSAGIRRAGQATDEFARKGEAAGRSAKRTQGGLAGLAGDLFLEGLRGTLPCRSLPCSRAWAIDVPNGAFDGAHLLEPSEGVGRPSAARRRLLAASSFLVVVGSPGRGLRLPFPAR